MQLFPSYAVACAVQLYAMRFATDFQLCCEVNRKTRALARFGNLVGGKQKALLLILHCQKVIFNWA